MWCSSGVKEKYTWELTVLTINRNYKNECGFMDVTEAVKVVDAIPLRSLYT